MGGRGEAPPPGVRRGSGMPGMGWSPDGSGKTIKIIQKAREKAATCGRKWAKGELREGDGGKGREMKGKDGKRGIKEEKKREERK